MEDKKTLNTTKRNKLHTSCVILITKTHAV